MLDLHITGRNAAGKRLGSGESALDPAPHLIFRVSSEIICMYCWNMSIYYVTLFMFPPQHTHTHTHTHKHTHTHTHWIPRSTRFPCSLLWKQLSNYLLSTLQWFASLWFFCLSYFFHTPPSQQFLLPLSRLGLFSSNFRIPFFFMGSHGLFCTLLLPSSLRWSLGSGHLVLKGPVCGLKPCRVWPCLIGFWLVGGMSVV